MTDPKQQQQKNSYHNHKNKSNEIEKNYIVMLKSIHYSPNVWGHLISHSINGSKVKDIYKMLYFK